MNGASSCPLCQPAGRELLWQNDVLRVVNADSVLHPGYTRVVWNDHVAEMTDLSPADRTTLMEAVWLVEEVQRQQLQPDKINLAAFGNIVPHLHWHVIPRWRLDSHFPESIWSAPPLRSEAQLEQWRMLKARIADAVPAYHGTLIEALNTTFGDGRPFPGQPFPS